MLSVEVQMEDRREPPREANGLLKRPCIEEFVAAGYKAENYDAYFDAEEWGPGWSNPRWTKEGTKYDEEIDDVARKLELPDIFMVHSQVRKVSTRTVRTRQPTRHKFKQYLLGDPHKRLTRRRPVAITARDLLRNLDTFIQDESIGKLSVHTRDGRRLDLNQLKVGMPLLSNAPPVPALYNRRLDSLQHDKPAGIPLPVYVDGTFPGDPAAQRALDRMTTEKQAEAIRQGATEEPVITEETTENAPEIEASISEVESVETSPETTEVSGNEEGQDDPVDVLPPPSDPEPIPPSIAVDPAAGRVAPQQGKRRRR